MSLKPMLWALDEADVAASQLLVLIALAERADENGANAWPGMAWIAQRARCSIRTCYRRLAEMEEAGILRRGDQRLVAHLPGDQRPVVWDIVMDPAERHDNLTPPDVTPVTPPRPVGMSVVSPPGAEGHDTPDATGMTAVADNTSFDSSLRSKSTAAAPPPPRRPTLAVVPDEQQQRADPPTNTDQPPDAAARHADLCDAMDEAGFHLLAWSGLRPEEHAEIDHLQQVHGIVGLVQIAVQARSAHRGSPPAHVRAPLTAWRTSRPRPRGTAAAVTTARCPIHSDQPVICDTCRADRTVVSGGWRTRLASATDPVGAQA